MCSDHTIGCVDRVGVLAKNSDNDLKLQTLDVFKSKFRKTKKTQICINKKSASQFVKSKTNLMV